MYDEMTITDLLVTAHQKAHPEDQPSSKNALLIDELARRLRRFDNWRSKVSAEINPYLTDDDGSDLLPEPERIRNMLKRLSSAAAAPQPVAVSERPWEREADWLGLDGECWWCPPDGPPYWTKADPAMVYGGWLLPAHALPLPTTTPAGQEGEMVAEWPAGVSRSYRAREACRLCVNASLPLESPEAKRLIRDAMDGMPLQAVHDLLAIALPLPATTPAGREGE